MAYRLLFTDFWTDPKVEEEMTPEDKIFYLYILTNPATTSCGIYSITKKTMAFHLGYSIETVNNLMERFEKHHKVIRYNPETRELAVKNWGKYNLSRGGKPVMDCLNSELSKVKDKTLIEYVMNKIDNEAVRKLYESFCDTPANRERQGGNTNTDTITDTYTNTKSDTSTENYSDLDSDTYSKTNISCAADEAHTLSITLIKEFEKLTGKPGVLNLPAVKIAVINHGYDNVKKAINKALEKGKFKMSYINGILKTWANEGYPTGGDVNGIGSINKNIGNGTNEYAAFKPKEPAMLSDEERRAAEAEVL